MSPTARSNKPNLTSQNPEEPKSGFFTSEFMLAALTIIGATILALFDKDLDGPWTTAVATATGAYSLSRGLAKFNSPTGPVGKE